MRRPWGGEPGGSNSSAVLRIRSSALCAMCWWAVRRRPTVSTASASCAAWAACAGGGGAAASRAPPTARATAWLPPSAPRAAARCRAASSGGAGVATGARSGASSRLERSRAVIAAHLHAVEHPGERLAQLGVLLVHPVAHAHVVVVSGHEEHVADLGPGPLGLPSALLQLSRLVALDAVRDAAPGEAGQRRLLVGVDAHAVAGEHAVDREPACRDAEEPGVARAPGEVVHPLWKPGLLVELGLRRSEHSHFRVAEVERLPVHPRPSDHIAARAGKGSTATPSVEPVEELRLGRVDPLARLVEPEPRGAVDL